MALAQTWIDDPEGTYKRITDNLQESFLKGIISGEECAAGKRTAAKCLKEGKRLREQGMAKGSSEV